MDRALMILGAALPEMSGEELAALSIGERDACLLTLREMTLGPALSCYVECPECSEQLEFTTRVEDIRVVPALQRVPHEHVLRTEGFEVRFRLLTSRDLRSLAGRRDVAAARALLLRRSVLGATLGGAEVAVEELPEPVVAALAAQVAERDPQAEVLFNLECPGCSHGWAATFDVVSFFWTELSALARRLLAEVHTLARAYGWREADILAMSSARRRAYLEMVAG
ncbi:MAG TPA: hypothetical protein VHG28_00180 [Longimicrobiaceae bacterium]|nr:hypothetical protein [Longimicrobiaceae bacterium]